MGQSLEGYRLNVLRVCIDMSCTGHFQTLMSNAPLFELVKEAQARRAEQPPTLTPRPACHAKLRAWAAGRTS